MSVLVPFLNYSLHNTTAKIDKYISVDPRIGCLYYFIPKMDFKFYIYMTIRYSFLIVGDMISHEDAEAHPLELDCMIIQTSTSHLC